MIPWVGDVVTINPDAVAPGAALKHFGGEEFRVKGIGVDFDDPSLVGVELEGVGLSRYRVFIRQPDGRSSVQPADSPSLFVLVHGAERCEFKAEALTPVPSPGDTVELTKDLPDSFTVRACTCGLPSTHWPLGKFCGAHIKSNLRFGLDWGLCYTLETTRPRIGWLFDGTLLRSAATQQPVWDATSLKIANTRPDAVKCAKCGSNLKDPGCGPLYRHCPKCEP
jgi:hypothetical protein